MGSGELKGWENAWDKVPDVCAGAWHQMEAITSYRFTDLKALEQAIHALRAPQASWHDSVGEFGANRQEAGCSPPLNNEQLTSRIRAVAGQDSGFIELDTLNESDKPFSMGIISMRIRQILGSPPNVLFIGGTDRSTAIAFFRRPLNAADFRSLWFGVTKR
jgi:hypothetical protein